VKSLLVRLLDGLAALVLWPLYLGPRYLALLLGLIVLGLLALDFWLPAPTLRLALFSLALVVAYPAAVVFALGWLTAREPEGEEDEP
jgi:hypothetical protein